MFRLKQNHCSVCVALVNETAVTVGACWDNASLDDRLHACELCVRVRVRAYKRQLPILFPHNYRSVASLGAVLNESAVAVGACWGDASLDDRPHACGLCVHVRVRACKCQLPI